MTLTIIPNPEIIKCISSIKDGIKILKDIDIDYDNEITFQKIQSCYFYEPSIRRSKYIAAFDLDWTLTYNEKHLFAKDIDDIQILPNRREMLVNIIKNGYNLCIFTNQYAKSKSDKEKKCLRIKEFLNKIKLPIFTYIATEKDSYRKPDIGMWNLFKKEIHLEKIIFVGDALGRPQDFSDSDLIFGRNINSFTDIYSPEDFFKPSIVPSFLPLKEIVIFVGAPGSGKSSYYSKYLADHIHLEQDKIGSRPKLLKQLVKSLKTNISIVIDSTNPSQENREEYYKLAIENGYSIKVLYFVRNGTGFNKLREKPVPTIAYHIFYKKLNPPTYLNTPGELFYIV